MCSLKYMYVKKKQKKHNLLELLCYSMIIAMLLINTFEFTMHIIHAYLSDFSVSMLCCYYISKDTVRIFKDNRSNSSFFE